MTIRLGVLVAAVTAAITALALVVINARDRPAPSRAAPSSILRVSGSGSTTGVLEKLAPSFTKGESDVRLKFLEGTDSGGGIAAVNARAIDIGGVSRAPKPGELEPGVVYRPFARDAAAFAVNGAGVDSLTRQQLKRAFAGEVTNWSQLGGRDLSIVVLVRDEDESLTQLLRRDLFGERFTFARNATVLSSTGDMNDALTATPGALGFTSYGSLVSRGEARRVVAVGTQRPSVAAVERGAYPFVRPLGIVFRPSDETSSFAAYLTSGGTAGRLHAVGYARSP